MDLEERKVIALRKAEEAFWLAVVAEFSEAESGDLCPLASAMFLTAAKKVIDEWVDGNV